LPSDEGQEMLVAVHRLDLLAIDDCADTGSQRRMDEGSYHG